MVTGSHGLNLAGLEAPEHGASLLQENNRKGRKCRFLYDIAKERVGVVCLHQDFMGDVRVALFWWLNLVR